VPRFIKNSWIVWLLQMEPTLTMSDPSVVLPLNRRQQVKGSFLRKSIEQVEVET